VPALVLAGTALASLAFAQAAGEKADSATGGPPWTAAQIRSFLPARGKFTFPAPYGTPGVRLTNPSDCRGEDCVQPLAVGSGRSTNNHRGRDTMLAVLGLRGSGPTLFRYDKRTDAVRTLGPLFGPSSPFAAPAAGWYFSATQPTTLYVFDGGPALMRYDVETRRLTTVFDIAAQLGEGAGLDRAHSSDDDAVHSASVRDSASRRVLGCLAYREKSQQLSYYPATTDDGECQVDKSGRWLLLRQRASSAGDADDRIIDLETGAETVRVGETSRNGPADTGYGYLIAPEASRSSSGAAVRIWPFDANVPGRVVYQAPSPIGDLRHVAHSNARPGVEATRQFACGIARTTQRTPGADEIVCFNLDGSRRVQVVAPTMSDVAAPSGSQPAEGPRGDLDSTGQYYVWVSTMGGVRADAFLVKVPAPLLSGATAEATLDAAHSTELAASASIVAAAADTVVTLSPQDTSLTLKTKTQSTNPLLMTYTWPARKAANAILMKFDLSAIPAGAVVSDATLGLALVQSDQGAESTYTVSAHKVVGKNPVITAATGFVANTGSAWTPNACCSGNVPLAQADISPAYDAQPIDKAPGYKSWSVTAIAQEWVASPATNFGLLLDPDVSALADRYRYFASMEHADPSLRPVLTIAYSMTPDVTPPALSAVSASAMTTTGATIAWTTDEPSDSQVEYGTTTAYGTLSPLAGTRVKKHTVALKALAPGTLYHFRVRSRDFAGNLAVSSDATFTTLADVTAPAVAVTKPVSGATVTHTVTMSASASDNVGVAGVQFKLDGANFGAEDTTSPYSVSWNTLGAANGSHAVAAVARDASGNLATSASVTVTVANDLTPPSVSITAPASGATLAGLVTVAASASDTGGVVGVQFEVSGARLGTEDTSAPYTVSWDTTLAGDGTYTVTGVARDLAGNSARSSGVTVTVANGIAVLVPQDTFIALNTTNQSTNATLMTYTWPDNQVANAILMKFDLSAIPTGAAVTDATLRLALLSSDATSDPTYTVTAHKVVGRSPVITTATGYTTDGVTAWTPNACCSNGVPLAQADISPPYDTRAIDKTVGTKSWSLTTMVQEWAASPTTNFGLLLNSDASKLRDRYRYFASIEHADATRRPSLRITYSLTPDVTPPVITAVTTSGLTLFGAAINWTTNEPSDSQVEYGLTTAYGSLTTLDPTRVSSHAGALGGLLANTLYHFRVRSRDFAGNLAVSGDFTLTTLLGDLTAPAVSITTPAAGATVTGAVTVGASASDNVGVAGVQFKLDGTNLGAEDTTSPYSVSWNTTAAANGSHALTAVARDAAGNVTTAATVTVTVSNDTTPPSVSITAPAAAATVAGTVAVSANASDNVGVVGVQFKLDGANLGAEDTTSPYSVSWNTTAAANGSHALTAVARDATGNVTTAATVTVTVSNDTTPPSVSITAPAGASTVSGTVAVSASASDNVAVAGVQFKLDGANLGAEDTSSPYSASWTTTGASNGPHSLTAVARDAAGNQSTSAAIAVTVSNLPPAGLAALYPGDVGIEAHPDVVFVERFEEATLTDLFSRWTDILNGSRMAWSSDVPAGSPGTHSVDIPWLGGGVSNGGHLYKLLSPGVDDTLYVRYYIKYPTSGRYNHSGVWMGGSNPPLSWPNPQAGIKPTGNDRFSAAAEPNNSTLRFDHYDYWMGMHQSNDGSYWGNLLRNDPNLVANPGQWMCVEHMVKLNNPVTSSSGEHAIWINGTKVSHVGQGFPNGSWSGGIFTQSPSGTPFEGLRWRSDANLKLNYIWLQNYSPDDPAGFQGHMNFDHLVAARSYIGCLPASAPPDAVPPAVSITTPAAGTTVAGTVAVAANASDNVGIVGVQLKVDGANVGAEDTVSPYSVSWTSSTAANGPHTLTAVARDAAGNQTTSPAVSLTVNNPVSGSILFESNWDTASGTSSAAVTDGGRWPNYWEFNGGSSVQLLSVVTGGVAGHNALRVQQRGSSFAANLQIDNFAPASTDFYVRYYMKNDDTSSAGDHIVTADTYQYANLTYMRKYGGPSTWQPVMSLYGCGYTYPIGHWTSPTRLANGQWYRFEYHVDYTASNRVQVHPRVYNAAGTLVLSDADFRQSDYGSQVWNGRSDWTLASYYAAGHDFCVDPTWMNDFGLGNNGQQGAADTGLYWYFAGLQLRRDGWPGPLF
jgi:hypothetical protein